MRRGEKEMDEGADKPFPLDIQGSPGAWHVNRLGNKRMLQERDITHNYNVYWISFYASLSLPHSLALFWVNT